MRWIISDTAGRETSSRSAIRAWMTSMSSSRSSQMASQYSSNAGWNSFDRDPFDGVFGMPRSLRAALRASTAPGTPGAGCRGCWVQSAPMPDTDPLEGFTEPVRAWFSSSFPEPTSAQAGAWPAIAAGDHTLLCAPTGSGKTLAAFLWAIDRLGSDPAPEPGVRVLYVSPLRALAVDVDKNLRSPLRGIALAAERLGAAFVEPTIGVRTGDSSAQERRALVRRPPDVLITTPESLYLMLTSQARATLTGVETVIVDEIHALAPTKRGAHLALSLERLEHLVRSAGRDPVPGRAAVVQRIGLSATQRPLEVVAGYLGGNTVAPGAAADTRPVPRPVRIVDAGIRKELDLQVIVPVEDLGALGEVVDGPASGPAAAGPVRRSIWPSMHPVLLGLVQEHHSTLVFVNARRLAERLASRLNELAAEQAADVPGTEATPPPVAYSGAESMGLSAADVGGELVKAHHGSLSRERRLQIEDELKRGDPPGPGRHQLPGAGHRHGRGGPGGAGGLTRLGRVRAPAHRPCRPPGGGAQPRPHLPQAPGGPPGGRGRGAAHAGRPDRAHLGARQPAGRPGPAAGRVLRPRRLVGRGPVRPGQGCRQLLGPQSGRCSSPPWTSWRAATRPRSSPSCVPGWCGTASRTPSGPGPGPSAWPSPRAAPSRTGACTGCSCPTAPGWASWTRRWSTSPGWGRRSCSGASTWRIEDITFERVVVTPAPGQPGKMPFWHGDGPGRAAELGRALGEFVREVRSMPPEAAAARLRERHALDEFAAANVLAYLDEQAEATGVVPDDRTIVVERFRDEIGDWRLCIHSPHGARVHAPWATVLRARLEEHFAESVGDGAFGVEVLWSDDGIVVRLPEAAEDVPTDVLFPDPDEIRAEVVAALPGTSAFAARFRECAARALLLPRRRPDQRTPLWQQRQRAADLLAVASKYPSFPILLEATRECCNDVFDLPALHRVLSDVRSRRIRVVPVQTPMASPFARSLLFGWIAVYMYEGRRPAGGAAGRGAGPGPGAPAGPARG